MPEMTMSADTHGTGHESGDIDFVADDLAIFGRHVERRHVGRRAHDQFSLLRHTPDPRGHACRQANQ